MTRSEQEPNASGPVARDREPPADAEGSGAPVPRWREAAETRRATRPDPGPRGRIRDTDVASRAQFLKIVTWSFLGGVIGGLAGVLGMTQGAWGTGTVALLFLMGWGIAFVLPVLITAASGRAATAMMAPSGRSTPHKREHSLAESLVARGLYEEGLAAFEAAITRYPSDPTPYLRIARVHRDQTGRAEDAARWFKRALGEAMLTPGAAALTRRELVELYVVRMGAPGRAAALLAKTAEEHAGTPEGEWATTELARVKQLVVDERWGTPREGPPPSAGPDGALGRHARAELP